MFSKNASFSIIIVLKEKVESVAGMELDTTTAGNSEGKGNVSPPPQVDHDYATLYALPPIMKMEPGKAWIDEDAPPMVR